MRVNPHLSFNGDCEAAFRFYEELLGGKVTFKMTYGESPMAEQVSPELRGKIIHATLSLDDGEVTGADAPPGRYEAPTGISMTVEIEEPTTADRVFAALAEGGKVQMPIQKTFWAERFGMVVDRFGIPWMVNCVQAA